MPDYDKIKEAVENKQPIPKDAVDIGQSEKDSSYITEGVNLTSYEINSKIPNDE